MASGASDGSVRLTKMQVVDRMAQGVYLEDPAQWVPDAIGYVLDPWQKRAFRKLFKKGPDAKARLAVAASHGSGKTFCSSLVTHFFLMNFMPAKVAITGPCVEENEPIRLADNTWVPVRELSGRQFEVFSMRVIMPDCWFSAYKAHAFPNGIKPVLRLTTQTGKIALRTPNHPFLKGFQKKNLFWENLENLRPGDRIAVPREQNISEKSLHYEALSPYLWESVRSVEYVGERMTYGIEVPGPQNYITNFIEHNTGKQTRSQVWSYIAAVWNRSVFKDDMAWYRTKLTVKAAEEEWFATWLTSKDPKSIEGFHGPDEGRNLLWIVEESKGVADGVFEAIQGALSHEDNYWYISSTCGRASGFFFDAFHSKSDIWETERVPYTESSRISEKQVEQWAKTWGRDSTVFRARVLAEFPAEDEKVIVPFSWYERALKPSDDGDDEGESIAA